MGNLFKPGDIVYTKKPPYVKLVVRRYLDKICQCRVYNHPTNKELSYDDIELRYSTNPSENKR